MSLHCVSRPKYLKIWSIIYKMYKDIKGHNMKISVSSNGCFPNGFIVVSGGDHYTVQYWIARWAQVKKNGLGLASLKLSRFLLSGCGTNKKWQANRFSLVWWMFFGVPNKHPRRRTTGKVIHQASYKIILNIFVIIFKYLHSHLLTLYRGSLNSTDFRANRNHATYWNKAKRL